MSREFDSLIGTDIENWDDYGEKAKKLITSPLIKKDRKNFLLALKHKISLNILEKEINLSQKSYSLGEFEVKNIDVSNGVNIIFGPKSTGKTKLLEAMYEENINVSKVIYKSENYDKNYIDIIKDKNFSNQVLKDNVDKIKTSIEIILKYKPKKFIEFKHFLNS